VYYSNGLMKKPVSVTPPKVATLKSLPDRVRHRRLKLGLSQKALAKRARTTQATVSRVELGRVREIRLGTLKRLADALEVGVGFLVGRQHDRNGDLSIANLAALPAQERFGPDTRLSDLAPEIVELARLLEDLNPEQVEEVARFARFLGRNKDREGE